MAVGECQNCNHLSHLWNAETDFIKDIGTTVYICPECKHGNYTDDIQKNFDIYEMVE